MIINKNIFRLIAYVTLIFLFSEGLIHFKNQNSTYKQINLTKDCTIDINGEDEFRGDSKYYELHNLKRGDEINIAITLPESDIKNAIVKFDSYNEVLRAYINDELVYSVGEYSDKKVVSGDCIAKIPVQNDRGGDKLKIKLKVNEPSVVSQIPNIILINAREADLLDLANNCCNLFIAVFLALLGLIGLVFILYNFGFDKEYRKVIWMSILSIIASVWIFTCFNIAEYFTNNYKILYYIEYISLFCSVIFICIYAREIISDEKRKKILLINTYVAVAYLVVAILLQNLHVFYFSQVLSIFHAIAIITLIIITIFFLIELKKSELKNNIIILAFLLLIAIAKVYAVLYIAKKSMTSYAIVFLPIVLLSWTIANFAGFIIDISKKYLSDTEKQYLLEMAYIDALTGISNRRVCENKLQEARENKEKEYIVYSFDINSLKYVNDTYGHTAGDEIINTFSEALVKVFCNEGDFVGRMGGDEFIALQYYNKGDETKIQRIIDEIEATVDLIESEKSNEYQLSFSSGYDICRIDDNKNIMDSYLAADEKMYMRKAKAKMEEKEKEEND